jgi:DUF971 family protein
MSFQRLIILYDPSRLIQTRCGMTEFWPTEIRVSSDRRNLTVDFDDGETFVVPAELMRVLSPSAEVQGHGPGQKQTVPGKIDVEISQITASGNYAIRITFSDGHDTGIFTWKYLRELGQDQDALFAAYCAELEQRGLKRETR